MPHLRHVGRSRGEAVLRIISAAVPRFFGGGASCKRRLVSSRNRYEVSPYIYISIIISIYINISFKILEASTRWWRRFQGCWWGAGDVLRLPRWYRDVSHLLLDPKGSVSSQLRQRYGFHVESIWNYERNTYDSLCGVFPNIWSLCYI